MEIQITSTDKMTELNGVPVRVWEGVTASGVACFVFVHRLAVREDRDASEFERELQEMIPPFGSGGKPIPLRQIL